MKIAIIGTAGRQEDGNKLDFDQWNNMRETAYLLIQSILKTIDTGDKPTLVSGGAAWADHVAVQLFNDQIFDGGKLELNLPAPFKSIELGFESKAGGSLYDPAETANYYHRKFSSTISKESTGFNSLADISDAIERGAKIEIFKGFKQRNLVVAKSDVVLAFTFGNGGKENEIAVFDGDVQADAAGLKDGGTAHTWNHAVDAVKIHAPLPRTVGGAAWIAKIQECGKQAGEKLAKKAVDKLVSKTNKPQMNLF